jgi:hypothetical protein
MEALKMIKINFNDKSFQIKAKTGMYSCYIFDIQAILKAVYFSLKSYIRGY